MHDLPPPMNVKLPSRSEISSSDLSPKDYYLQIGVYTRNTSVGNTLRKRRQPTFRFPLNRVGAPNANVYEVIKMNPRSNIA